MRQVKVRGYNISGSHFKAELFLNRFLMTFFALPEQDLQARRKGQTGSFTQFNNDGSGFNVLFFCRGLRHQHYFVAVVLAQFGQELLGLDKVVFICHYKFELVIVVLNQPSKLIQTIFRRRLGADTDKIAGQIWNKFYPSGFYRDMFAVTFKQGQEFPQALPFTHIPVD